MSVIPSERGCVAARAEGPCGYSTNARCFDSAERSSLAPGSAQHDTDQASYLLGKSVNQQIGESSMHFHPRHAVRLVAGFERAAGREPAQINFGDPVKLSL